MKNPKSILITGATSGIGEYLALNYAQPGVHLSISGRNQPRLDKICAKIIDKGATVEGRILDVSDKAAMRVWIETIDSVHPLDLVIANAGVGLANSEVSSRAEMTETTFNINVNGVFHTVHPAIDCMMTRDKQGTKGQIAIVASLAGFVGMASSPSYSASKNAVRAYGEALRPDLAKHNISVNVICPGFVRSRITDKNKYKMPFFMETDDAAKLILRELAKDTPRIAFPKRMYWMIRFMQMLPWGLASKILNKAPRKD